MPTDMYKYNDVTGTWDDYSKDDKYMTNVVNNGTDIKVCGIIRPNDDAVSTSLQVESVIQQSLLNILSKK